MSEDLDWACMWRAVYTGSVHDMQNVINQLQARHHHVADLKQLESRTRHIADYVEFDDGSPLWDAVLLNDVEKVRLLLYYDASISCMRNGKYPRGVAQELYEKNGKTHLKVLKALNKAELKWCLHGNL